MSGPTWLTTRQVADMLGSFTTEYVSTTCQHTNLLVCRRQTDKSYSHWEVRADSVKRALTNLSKFREQRRSALRNLQEESVPEPPDVNSETVEDCVRLALQTLNDAAVFTVFIAEALQRLERKHDYVLAQLGVQVPETE